MSNVSGVNSYTSGLYQWQNQKLSTSTSGSSSSSGSKSSSSSLSQMLSGSSISSQLSSMVDLTKYAMDAMGLDSDSRVTFSQITKYRDQLNTEFNTAVKEGLAKLGVSDPSSVTFTLAADGSLTASSTNATDQANVQAWLKNNATVGKDLRTALTAAGVSPSTSVAMTVDSTGKLTAASSTDSSSKAAIQAVLDNSKLGQTLNTGMSNLAVSSDAKFTLQTKSDGSIVVESSDAATKAAVQKFFDNNPSLVKKFGQIQALSGLDDARKSLQVSPSDLRKRIEVESMAAWWSGSDNSTSSFGSYSSGSLSMLSGLNLSV
ncbi:MAG: hypothetical protein QM665_00705 [Desulfovibrio sp.]